MNKKGTWKREVSVDTNILCVIVHICRLLHKKKNQQKNPKKTKTKNQQQTKTKKTPTLLRLVFINYFIYSFIQFKATDSSTHKFTTTKKKAKENLFQVNQFKRLATRKGSSVLSGSFFVAELCS